MKFFAPSKLLIALLCSAALTSFALAHEGHKKNESAEAAPATGTLVKVADAGISAEWLAHAKADYPLTICPVSEDKLEGGDMGPPQDYVYRQEGKPDRFVRFCCKDCVRDFKKDPAKYLQLIDEGAAAKAKPEHSH